MTADRDFRLKITVETDAVLDVLSRVSGRDRNDIAREILHEHALAEIEKHRLLQARLAAEGIHATTKGAHAATEGAHAKGQRGSR